MKEARGRRGVPKAKSEGGILNLSLPLRIWDVTYPYPTVPSEFPLTGQEGWFLFLTQTGVS